MAGLLHLGDNLSPKEVYDFAAAGDDRARRVFEIMGEMLGVALAMLANTFNYPLYLLSGGILPAWEFFAPKMFEVTRERSFTFRTTDTRIDKATLGNEAGLYGAAYLPWVEGA
jgi:glucokinase